MRNKHITLPDGFYVVNHFTNRNNKGRGEREIEIKNGSVICGEHKFSQCHFFDVNFMVNRIK